MKRSDMEDISIFLPEIRLQKNTSGGQASKKRRRIVFQIFISPGHLNQGNKDLPHQSLYLPKTLILLILYKSQAKEKSRLIFILVKGIQQREGKGR